MPTRRSSFPLAALGPGLLGVVAVAAYVFAPSSPSLNLGLFESAGVLALIVLPWGGRRAAAAERLAWFSASTALTGFLAGGLIWLRYPGADAGPFHSLPDTIFLLSCVPLAFAANALASAREPERDHSAVLDAGILTTVAGVVVWSALIDSHIHDASLAVSTRVLDAAHPLVDVIALGFVLRLALSRAARNRSTASFAAGAGLLIGTDLYCRWLQIGGGFRPGTATDTLWLLSYLLIGFAPFLSPSERTTRAVRREAVGSARLAVVLAAVVVPEVVLGLELAHRKLIGLNTLTIAVLVSTAAITLAATRLRSLLGQARRAEADRGEARLSALILHSAEAIFLVDSGLRISFASPSAEELWGRKASRLLGASLLDAFADDDRQVIARRLEDLVTQPAGATVPLEGRVRVNDGQLRMLEGIGRNLLGDDHVGAVVVTLRDTTSRRELEHQLERHSFHDDLTGLANRALFTDRLAHALNRSTRDHDVEIAVLFVDLDDFKSVNDGMGHSAGDELIRGVAARIQTCVRPGDTVARLGGDEFAVLIEDISSVAAVQSLSERMLEVLQLPLDVLGVSLAVPASVGVTFANRESTAESLLRDADTALYSAKSQGKSRIALFEPGLRDDAVQRLALKVELPEALRSCQFRLAYQPIKDTLTNDLRGFEALIRWHHPDRGPVSPAAFIPAAEETGIIVDIGRWVLGEACQQALWWNRGSASPLSINVNVSGLQLEDPGFVSDVRQVLERTGLAPALLTLELTESVLVKHQRMKTILDELRSIGVGIAIDDFGTGYSSLSYLQQFPATSVKVDQSFIAELGSAGGSGLVKSIISIGDALGLTTVAEGVETAEQLATLKELGCDRVQGYLLGRPQTSGEIDNVFAVDRMNRTAEWRRATAATGSS